MKKYILLILLFPLFLFSQENPETNESGATVSGGFGDTPWGMSFKEVRKKYESLARNPDTTENIQILNEIKNKLLIVKRNNVNYIYRFYKKPKEVKEVEALKDVEQDHRSASGLFSVGVVFSPVESTRVRDSLKKYGSPTREYLVENMFGIIQEEKTVKVVKKETKTETDPEAKPETAPTKKEEDADEPEEVEEEDLEEARKIPAAYIWNFESEGESGGGFIIQWNEPYQKRLYTKRLDYFSSELSSIINSDYKKYFSARETKIINDLLSTPPILPTEEPTKTKTETTIPPEKTEPTNP